MRLRRLYDALLQLVRGLLRRQLADGQLARNLHQVGKAAGNVLIDQRLSWTLVIGGLDLLKQLRGLGVGDAVDDIEGLGYGDGDGAAGGDWDGVAGGDGAYATGQGWGSAEREDNVGVVDMNRGLG